LTPYINTTTHGGGEARRGQALGCNEERKPGRRAARGSADEEKQHADRCAARYTPGGAGALDSNSVDVSAPFV